jgi:hypothetical protein
MEQSRIEQDQATEVANAEAVRMRWVQREMKSVAQLRRFPLA